MSKYSFQAMNESLFFTKCSSCVIQTVVPETDHPQYKHSNKDIKLKFKF